MTAPTTSALATLMVVAALFSSCASSDYVRDADAPDRVTITVENQNWQDANIYLIGSGPRVRLGTVGTNAREVFVVPRSVLAQGSVRLAVDLIGSRAAQVTDPILIFPGADVHWTLQNHLALSSYHVR